MIDQVTGPGPWTHKKSACPIGRAEGRAECEATHDRLIADALGVVADASEAEYAMGTQDAFERGEARGRWQGVLIVAVLVGLAWIWRRR